jgi:hypothetical protein
MPKIHRLAPLLFALTLAACGAQLTARAVPEPPPAELIATGDAGPPSPPPDDPDSKPSPTLPLPPPAAALALLTR